MGAKLRDTASEIKKGLCVAQKVFLRAIGIWEGFICLLSLHRSLPVQARDCKLS